jgi:hypothetical protein
MAMPMTRKQVYLTHEQDRKLKRLAARRNCTEAEIIREALTQIPDPDGDLVEQLRTDGALLPKQALPDLPMGAAARQFLEEYEAWLDANPRDLRLTEAVLEDRGSR